jgi:hypothetical protein
MAAIDVIKMVLARAALEEFHRDRPATRISGKTMPVTRVELGVRMRPATRLVREHSACSPTSRKKV